MKLATVNLKAEDKRILAMTIEPKTIAEICANTDLSYSSICQKLQIWKAKKFVIANRAKSGRVLYELNQEVIQP